MEDLSENWQVHSHHELLLNEKTSVIEQIVTWGDHLSITMDVIIQGIEDNKGILRVLHTMKKTMKKNETFQLSQ